MSSSPPGIKETVEAATDAFIERHPYAVREDVEDSAALFYETAEPLIRQSVEAELGEGRGPLSERERRWSRAAAEDRDRATKAEQEREELRELAVVNGGAAAEHAERAEKAQQALAEQKERTEQIVSAVLSTIGISPTDEMLAAHGPDELREAVRLAVKGAGEQALAEFRERVGEFDSWLSFRGEFSEVLGAFRKALAFLTALQPTGEQEGEDWPEVILYRDAGTLVPRSIAKKPVTPNGVTTRRYVPAAAASPPEREEAMNGAEREWITCPRCQGEGEVGMEWVDERFIAGSGQECPVCKGAEGFDDKEALGQALSITVATFRAEIVGHSHPHRGVRGICDLTDQLQDMVLVAFDSPGSHGADSAYAKRSEIRELREGESSDE